MDYSPPGSSDHGISQAGMLEWVAISSSGHLPDPGTEAASLCLLHWQAESLPLSHLGSPLLLPKERLTNRVRREQNESDLKKLAFEMVLGFQWLTWEQGRQGAVNPGPGQAAPKSASLAY